MDFSYLDLKLSCSQIHWCIAKLLHGKIIAQYILLNKVSFKEKMNFLDDRREKVPATPCNIIDITYR